MKRLLFQGGGDVALEAKPISKPATKSIIDRDTAYILGGTEAKITSILNGCQNSSGLYAIFDQAMLKRLTNLVALLAPAAAGTVLTFL